MHGKRSKGMSFEYFGKNEPEDNTERELPEREYCFIEAMCMEHVFSSEQRRYGEDEPQSDKRGNLEP